jgi:hypothetical protein
VTEQSRGVPERSQYYFNTETGEVEEGKKSSWLHRMGPYDTAEEAAHAFQRAAQRNAAEDAADRAWQEEWEGPAQWD